MQYGLARADITPRLGLELYGSGPFLHRNAKAWLFESLIDAGYDGYLSLEYEGPDEARYANNRGLDNLRRILEGAG